MTNVMISAVVATFITNSGRSAWFIGILLLFVYAIFVMTPYIVPLRTDRDEVGKMC